MIEKTHIEGCFKITPQIYRDDRGLFYEVYGKEQLADINIDSSNMQSNLSESKYGVLRGLHFQTGEFSQTKLLTVVNGKVLDVVVDCRKSSPSFGKVLSVYLTKHTQLYVPEGCAHGFVSLENDTIFIYNCNKMYSKDSESGIRYDDPELNIDWLVEPELLIISDKDKELPLWKDCYKFD